MGKEQLIFEIEKRVNLLVESPLYEFRLENNYQPVIGEGNLDADIVFIGEAPGKNEALSGKPFCGRAGKVLDELLGEAQLRREDVYITNIVKDRPPNNRRPTKEEVEIYSPFLIRQLEIIQPKVIVTLGSTSARFAFDHLHVPGGFKAFGEVEGQLFNMVLNSRRMLLFPLFHPAYAIYQRTNLPAMRERFKQIPALLAGENEAKI
ncbi:MAG: uracil-DNA glycosylase [Chloroflexi bacterium]|nr:uracil-DNA glycosylase [Chloroflexota bacterium]